MNPIPAVLAFVLVLAACSPGDGKAPAGQASSASAAMSLAEESQVLSVFKMAETFQAVRLTDRENFARTLADLKAEGYSSGRQFEAVIEAQQQGVAWKGYRYRDIVQGERGALDNGVRYGLAAIPEKPGGMSYLLLIDLAKLQISENGSVSRGIGGEIYKSGSAPDPGDRWPSAAELTRWDTLRRLSPQEALEAAKDLKQKYDEGRQ
jgi:hypothetical protein